GSEWRVREGPAGAAAVAALTSEVYRPEKDERVAVMICGSNTDPSMLAV
nr:threonine/serine dehydratase [Rhodospirillaceae bacterium]